MAGGLLVVGESLEPLRDLEETFLDLVAMNLIPTILLSLAAGVWLAAASARRVNRIEAALARMAEGDLSARVDPGDALPALREDASSLPSIHRRSGADHIARL